LVDQERTTPLGMQASIFGACPKPGWERCGRKDIWHKNGGMMEMSRWLVPMEWHPAGWSVCLPLYLPLHHKSPEDFFWHRLNAAVLHCNGDSVNCGTTTAYRIGDLHHFLCWSPGDDIQWLPPLRQIGGSRQTRR